MSGLHDATLGAQTRQKTMLEQEEAACAFRMKLARADLRDRFAGHALTGLLAARNFGEAVADRAFMIVAAEAWRQADAMLATREENSQ